MRRLIILLSLISLLAAPAVADEFTAPPAPDVAQDLMPVETTSFGKDLWKIIQEAVSRVNPEFTSALGSCVSVFAAMIALSMIQVIPGNVTNVVRLVSTLAVAALFLKQTNSMIRYASDTVQELNEYGKLLLPVLAAAKAAQGGVSASTALFTGTTVFNVLLCSAIKILLIPLIYIYLVISICGCATGQSALVKLKELIKWLSVWLLKMVLYIFTGYIGITGVISGSADAAVLKAAKLTMSGMIPVVGGILSDASETVLASAGIMKNAVGVYGVLTLIAIWIMPFLQIGIRYLLLKLTAAISPLFGANEVSQLIGAFSDAMGLLLAVTGSVSIMLLIGTVCFMNGVG